MFAHVDDNVTMQRVGQDFGADGIGVLGRAASFGGVATTALFVAAVMVRLF